MGSADSNFDDIVCSVFNLDNKNVNAVIARELSGFIIWQDSLEVNPSVLMGSFLVGILPDGPFPW